MIGAQLILPADPANLGAILCLKHGKTRTTVVLFPLGEKEKGFCATSRTARPSVHGPAWSSAEVCMLSSQKVVFLRAGRCPTEQENSRAGG